MRSMPHIHKERLAAGRVRQLRVFIDKCSIEVFDADGKMSMTNFVFPTTPYNKVSVKGKAKIKIYAIKGNDNE